MSDALRDSRDRKHNVGLIVQSFLLHVSRGSHSSVGHLFSMKKTFAMEEQKVSQNDEILNVKLESALMYAKIDLGSHSSTSNMNRWLLASVQMTD